MLGLEVRWQIKDKHSPASESYSLKGSVVGRSSCGRKGSATNHVRDDEARGRDDGALGLSSGHGGEEDLGTYETHLRSKIMIT